MGDVIPFPRRPAPPAPPQPDVPRPRTPSDPPEVGRWTRAQLAADRNRHAFTPGDAPRDPDAPTRAQLAEDRRRNAHTWRLRAGLFAPTTPDRNR